MTPQSTAQPTRSFLPEDPLGSDHQHDDQDDQGAHVLEVGGIQMVDSWTPTPDDDATDESAEGGAETTERDGGEHQQQDAETHVPPTCSARASNTPPSAASDPPMTHTSRITR